MILPGRLRVSDHDLRAFSGTFAAVGGTDPVPEPATLSLLGLGLAGMAARRLHRK